VLLWTWLRVTGDAPVPGRVELLKAFAAQLKEWGSLLQRFLKSEDDQVRVTWVTDRSRSELKLAHWHARASGVGVLVGHD
jgi:hypothetical protein